MATRTEAEPRHRGLHLPPQIILPAAGVLAALAVGGYALSRGGEPSSPVIDNAPVSDAYKPPEEPPKQPELPVVALPSPTEKPALPIDGEKIKPFECSILSSPETCVTGEYIEWTAPDGVTKLRGIGFMAKPGDVIKIPKALQVSKTAIEQPNVYRGIRLTGKTMDNSETYQYWGSFDLENLGTKNLEAGTVTTVAEGGQTVFPDQPYTFIFRGPQHFMDNEFPEVTKQVPKIINNPIPNNPAPGSAVFYGIPVPDKS